jgi:hypothetical protein
MNLSGNVSVEWARAGIATLAVGILAAALLAPPVQAQESGAALAAPGSVNIELILDVSGSMAEPVAGSANQTRMAAAQAALREVIANIPEGQHINVGLRVYGQDGSNAEADRTLSCRSTELLVPMHGLDRQALLAEVDAAEPTGWTPLARALQAAASDFAPGEGVSNAIIMVTDGEDTCGGDPCQMAAALQAADVAVTTHVVGLALTNEQQDAVRCIAEEGGGQLFAATDAESLRTALDTAYAEVVATPETSSTAVELRGYVGGNAFSVLPEGAAGELSVVAVGQYDGRQVPIVVQNRTGAPVQLVQVSALARSEGNLVATGSDWEMAPVVVEDSGLAFGDIYFGAELPEGTAFEFTLAAEPANEVDASELDLTVTEANSTGDRVIAVFENRHEVPVGDVTIQADLACFSADGALLDIGFAPAGSPLVEPGGVTPGQFALPEASADLQTETCPVFLIAAQGGAGS